MTTSVATYKQIQGPPGTGKTDVSSAIVSNWVWQMQSYNYYDNAETICAEVPLVHDKGVKTGKIARTAKVLVVVSTNAGLDKFGEGYYEKGAAASYNQSWQRDR